MRVIPYYFHDYHGGWDLCRDREDHCGEPDDDFIEIPDELLGRLHEHSREYTRAMFGIAEVITDYVDANPDTKVNYSVQRMIDLVRQRRRNTTGDGT